MTDKDYIDLVLNTADQRVQTERQDNRISSELDLDIEITKYVPPPKTFGKIVSNQPVKFTVQGNISSDDGFHRSSIGPSNSQSSSIQSNTSKLINLYNSFSSESEEDTSIVRSESGKVYVKQSYWEKTPVKHVKQLPYDIDGRGIFNVPFNPEKRFESSRDGRPWSKLMRSRRSGFKSERFMVQCKGLFRYCNPHCRHVAQQTGLIEDSSHLRACGRVATICVKDKSEVQGKYLSRRKINSYCYHKTFWNSLVFSNQINREKRYQRNYCV